MRPCAVNICAGIAPTTGGGDTVAVNWKALQAELDADVAQILADCAVRADALCAEVYGDLYGPAAKAS